MIYLNGVQITPTIFPDKTSQVWKIDESLFREHNEVLWAFETEGEIMHLAQLKDLLNKYSPSASLILTYLPYGRQDKGISNGATFALNTFAKLLNEMNFDEVICTDPHSNEAGKLINNFEATYPLGRIDKTFSDTESDLVCYPDKGAFMKYIQILHYDFTFADKVRNQDTGFIESYELNQKSKVMGKTVLIVDDICDGGMTFILLCKELKAAGAKEVHLFVSHGIFSKGIQVLKDSGINRIFTKDGEVK